MTATDEKAKGPAPSTWMSTLVRALSTAEASIGYDHVRMGFIRELMRLGREHFGREVKAQGLRDPFGRGDEFIARGKLLETLKISRFRRNSLEKRSASAWDALPSELRLADRHIAEQFLPYLLQEGFERAVGRFDREVANAAMAQSKSRRRAGEALRVTGEMVGNMLERQTLQWTSHPDVKRRQPAEARS